MDNVEGIYFYHETEDAVVAGNSFCNNSHYSIRAHYKRLNPVNATNNWWGTEFGPFHIEKNPYGDGDHISDYVHFDPWIGKETLESLNLSEIHVSNLLARDIIFYEFADFITEGLFLLGK